MIVLFLPGSKIEFYTLIFLPQVLMSLVNFTVMQLLWSKILQMKASDTNDC